MKEMYDNKQVEYYVYNQPKSGNSLNGDSYYIYSDHQCFICAIADGLGNGPMAKQSSEIIPKVLEEYRHESIEQLFSRCNEQMHQKRGAAVAILKIDLMKNVLEYSCVGNIRFYFYRRSEEKMIYPIPVMGYLAGRRQSIKTYSYLYEKDDFFLLHSDGLEVRSPKNILRDSQSVSDLYDNLLCLTKDQDDTTFITGSLP